MWWNIIKVDEFASRGSTGSYNHRTDKVKLNLDRFQTADKKYSDEDRIAEFTDVATHEYLHREFGKEMPNYAQKGIDKIIQMVKDWANKKGNTDFIRRGLSRTIQKIEPEIMSLATKFITDETFAHTSMRNFKGPVTPQELLPKNINNWFVKFFRDLIGSGDNPIFNWTPSRELDTLVKFLQDMIDKINKKTSEFKIKRKE